MSLPETERLPEQITVPGLPQRYPSILPFALPKWPLWVWFIIGVVMVPIASIPIMGLARYTTTSSEFCVTCHGTGETPNRAVKSLVHPDFDRVACIDCHAKPGQIVFEGYMKGFLAEPDRVTGNCVRCHDKMTQTNDTKGFKFNFLEIKIPHKLHIEKGAQCTNCHANIAHDLNVPQTNRPRMEYCFSCHAQNDPCTKCHGGSVPAKPVPVPAPMAAGSSPDGRVLYMRVCAACHGQKGDRVKQANLSSLEFIQAQGDAHLFKATSEGQGIMPAFARDKGGQLTDDEIRAALGYIKVLALGTSASKIDAKALYDANCVRCHGSDGDKIAGVKHSSKEFWYSRGEEAITKAIANGKGGMPPFAKSQGGTMSDIQIRAIVEFLKSFRKEEAASAGPINGKDIYAKNCAMCHGDKGSNVPNANLSSKDFVASKGDENLAKGIAQGTGPMPGFGKIKGGALSDDQIKALVDYIKELAGAK